MQKSRVTQKAFVALAASIGLPWVFAIFACRFGFLFGGLEAGFAVLATAALCCVAVLVTAIILKRKAVPFPWSGLVGGVALLAFVGIGLYSWTQTAKAVRMFLAPASVPSSVRAHNGRAIMFSSFVHFTGSPAEIAAVIRTKGLVEIPAEPPEQGDISSYSERERTKSSWGWWQPMTMPAPRFFYRHHKSKSAGGWSEGWWVSSATNEVYALIGG